MSEGKKIIGSEPEKGTLCPLLSSMQASPQGVVQLMISCIKDNCIGYNKHENVTDDNGKYIDYHSCSFMPKSKNIYFKP